MRTEDWLLGIFSFATAFSLSEGRVCANDECRLLDNLLENYNRNSRPILDVSSPIRINASLEIIYLNDLDEITHMMSTFTSIQLQWFDQFLTWDPGEYGGIQEITLPPMFIWFPDVLIENKYDSLDSEAIMPQSENTEKVRVRWDGKVLFERKGILNTKCWVKMTHFPFDEHLCTITLAANSDTVSRLKIHSMGSFQVSKKAFNKQYGIEGHCSMLGDLNRPQTSDKFSFLHVALLFARRPMVHLWTLWLPIILLALVAMLVFALPADSGEKISLGITVNLSFTVFQSTVQQLLPNNTDNIPILAIFVGLMMFLTTLSLVMTVIVLRLYLSDDVPSPPKRLLSVITALDLMCPGSRVSKVVPLSKDSSCLTNSTLCHDCPNDTTTDVTELQQECEKQDDPSDKEDTTPKDSPEEDDVTGSPKSWKYIAQVLDKLFLLIFLLIFISATMVSLTLSFFGDYKRIIGESGFFCADWQEPVE